MNQSPSLSATFLLSAMTLRACPADEVPEVAFVGRSNSGKSSTLNCITGNRKLARVGKTPGRTRALNLFEVQSGGRFVDLPGYGYAKASRQAQREWNAAAADYLQHRRNLAGLVIVTDCRRTLTDMDGTMLEWAVTRGVPCLLLLNKADKLKLNARLKALHEMQAALSGVDELSVLLFSAVSGLGKPNALEWMDATLSNLQVRSD